MRVPFAVVTMDIAYSQDKSVTIRRFPTKYETEELKKSKYKLVDDELSVSDNQFELSMFYNPRRKQVNVISGGMYDFKEGGKYGVDIDLKVTHPEKELHDYLSNILRKLCNKHLKACVLFQSRYSINCQIDECKLTEAIVKEFLEDFITTIESSIEAFKITRKEKKIEEGADEQVKKIEEQVSFNRCADCDKELNSDREHWYDEDKDEVIDLCPDCWGNRRKKLNKKLNSRWKIALIILTIIACASAGLMLKAILGI